MCVCERESVYVCEREYVCVCVRERERERESVWNLHAQYLVSSNQQFFRSTSLAISFIRNNNRPGVFACHRRYTI